MHSPMADFRIVTFVKQTGDNYTTNDTLIRNFKVLKHEIHDDLGWVAKDVDRGVSYNWIELTSSKIDSVDTLATGDDGAAWVRLGRHTVLYGDTIDSVYVGSNGAIKLVGEFISAFNNQLPIEGPVVIAPFWDDLYVKGNITGGPDSLIYVRRWTDSTVIEWYRVPKLGLSSPFTFEVIIYTPPPPGHGNIKFQYKDMSEYDSEEYDATIGMQDSSSNSNPTSNYVLYTYDENPFTPNWSAGKSGDFGLLGMRVRRFGNMGVAMDDAKGGKPKAGQAILFVNPQPTGVEEDEGENGIPRVLALYPNMPNPFNKKTVITYAVPQKMEVELEIYDVAGRYIVSLAKGKHEPGIYHVEWGGRDSRGMRLPAGVYFYRLHTAEKTLTRKLVLVR